MHSYLIYVLLVVALSNVAFGASQIGLMSYSAPDLAGGIGYYYLYTPSNYSCSQMRYPLLYLLHGASSNGTDWIVSGTIQDNLDYGIANQLYTPMMVVLPVFPKSWYVDSGYMKAETTFIKNLWTHVEVTYANRLVPANSNSTGSVMRGRFIGGVSMGGYGSLRFMMLYPQLFASVFTLSPAVYMQPPPISTAYTQPPFQTNGTFDISKWKSYNYPVLINNYYAKNDLRPIFITSGDKDRFNITYEAHALYWELFRLRAGYGSSQTAFRVYDGDHVWPLWRATVNEAITWTTKYVTSAYVDTSIPITDPLPCAPADSPSGSSTPNTVTIAETVEDKQFVHATIGLSIGCFALVCVIVAMLMKAKKES